MVVPVNRQLEPECAPFMAAIQDISKNGIRLLHTRAIYSDYMALKWQATTLPYETIELVSNVRRCQPRSPFYSIGGEFLLAD